MVKVDSAKIARAMATLDVHDYGDVVQCMRCGSCLPFCPTYRTDGIETQSPRGRIAMIKAVIDGRLEASEEFIDHMYHCLDCRNCQTVCPAGVKVGELVLEARHRIEQNLPQPLLKRYILNHAIKDQKKLSRFLTPLRIYQNIGLQRLIRNSEILKFISSDLEFMEGLLPPLSSRPLIETLPEEVPAIGPRKGTVGFFLGCAMNLVFSEISRNTVEVLSKAGYRVIIPKSQQCCGTPNIAEGERKIYREMAEHNISLFQGRGIEAVITDCAACGMELKGYKENLSRRPSAARAENFSHMVRDVSEFLAVSLDESLPLNPINEKVCFHDPCHLRHGQKLIAPQRALLRRIPGANLRELADEGQCCGSAGIYNITHHERSMKILEAKIAAIEKTGVDRVVTSNPGCYMQLLYAARVGKKSWKVSHISQVLASALNS
jgi:glycolate oxidase iron-sulfur subunit